MSFFCNIQLLVKKFTIISDNGGNSTEHTGIIRFASGRGRDFERMKIKHDLSD